MPQPNLVPFRFNSSRSTQSNGISGSPSYLCCFPLMVSVIMKPSRGEKPGIPRGRGTELACAHHFALSGNWGQPIPGKRIIPGGEPYHRIGERTEVHATQGRFEPEEPRRLHALSQTVRQPVD